MRSIDEVVTASDKSYYYYYNGHGDVTALLDLSNNIVAESYTYDAFGNLPDDFTSTVDNPILYSGYQYDEETELYYLNARMYDPEIARFMQMDTYLGRTEDPLSLNLYTYALNNPIRCFDPTGHWEQEDSKYKPEVQAQLIALTNAYYSAETKAERDAIHEQAKDLRNPNNEKDETDNYTNDTVEAIEEVVDTAVNKRGYMEKDEWDGVINSQGITYKVVSSDDTPSIEPSFVDCKSTDVITSFDEDKIANIVVSTAADSFSIFGNDKDHNYSFDIDVTNDFRKLFFEGSGKGANYIFYTASHKADFENQANYFEEQLLDQYMLPVYSIEVSTAQEFIGGWNGMDIAEEVMIIAHTNFHSILFEHEAATNALSTNGLGFNNQQLDGDISSLNRKTIETLTIHGCNSGLIEAANIARYGYSLHHAFFNNNDVNIVHAWDGSVGFGPSGFVGVLNDLGFGDTNYNARLSNKQKSIYSHLDRLNQPHRKPTGLVTLTK